MSRAVETERNVFNIELEKLQNKLHWYAENQELLDKTASECGELKILVSICKREIKKAGTIEWKSIRNELDLLRTDSGTSAGLGGLNDSLLEGEEVEEEEMELEGSSAVLPMHKRSSPSSKSNTTTPTKHNKNNKTKPGRVGQTVSPGIVPMKRSPADIKRIK